MQIPVTLKMLFGWGEQSTNAPELARLAQAKGIAMLSAHGHTRCQSYSLTADWKAIGKVRQAVSIPVAANCDCLKVADAQPMLAQSAAGAGMIGHTATGQPWFVGDAAYYFCHGKARAGPSPAKRKRAKLEICGTGHGSRHSRQHIAAFAERAGSKNRAELRVRLVRLVCPKAVKSALCELFDSRSAAEAA